VVSFKTPMGGQKATNSYIRAVPFLTAAQEISHLARLYYIGIAIAVDSIVMMITESPMQTENAADLCSVHASSRS